MDGTQTARRRPRPSEPAGPSGLPPTHPGEILREDVLPALGRPITEIAQLLGMSRGNLYNVLNGKQPVTVDMAVRLGKLISADPAFWLRLQAAHDVAVARVALAAELERLPVLYAGGPGRTH